MRTIKIAISKSIYVKVKRGRGGGLSLTYVGGGVDLKAWGGGGIYLRCERTKKFTAIDSP